MAYDRLVMQLNKTTLECGIWGSLTQERDDDVNNLQFLLLTSKDEYKLIESLVAAIQKENEAVSLERYACNPTIRFQALFNRYRYASNHVEKRLIEEGLHLDASRAAAATKAKGDVSGLLRGRVLSTKSFLEEHIPHMRASFSNCTSTGAQNFHNIKGELQDIVFGQCFLGNGSLNVGCVPPSRVLFLFWIVSAPEGDSSGMTASDKDQAASSTRAKKISKTSPKHPP